MPKLMHYIIGLVVALVVMMLFRPSNTVYYIYVIVGYTVLWLIFNRKKK